MTILFGRRWSLQVGGLDLSDLDLAFKVERAITREPNTAVIRVWNLAPTTRATVERGGAIRLYAGYEDPPLLFSGDSRAVWTERDGLADYVTTIEARDGGRAYSEARIARSYAAGTRCVTALRDVVAAMDIGTGNLDEFESAYRQRNGATTFPDGWVASGPCRRVLSDLARAAGLRWSVQNGALQLLQAGTPLQSRAVVLAADSGLIETPMWDERGRLTRGRRGLLSARTLIQPGIDPGRRVRVESSLVEGDFEVAKAAYAGDTRGNDWTATLSLRSLAG